MLFRTCVSEEEMLQANEARQHSSEEREKVMESPT